MSKKVSTAKWDDIESNNGEQLSQMLKELEVPHLKDLPKDKAILLVKHYLSSQPAPDPESIIRIFKDFRISKMPHHPLYFFRLLVFLTVFLILAHISYNLSIPAPFCSHDKVIKSCQPCPFFANCSKGKAHCQNDLYLASIGCRPKRSKKYYKMAEKAAIYIAQRDGDCIESQPPLSVEAFSNLFPSIEIDFFKRESGFHISVQNGTVFSSRPSPTLFCKAINVVERNAGVFGPLSFAMIIAILAAIAHIRHRRMLERAKELSRLAHRILSTTDKAIYCFDMKVQLRVKDASIDSLWKYVVKYIEEDSHVLIGVAGARREVYWKWIQTWET